jgi:hypothetical protein
MTNAMGGQRSVVSSHSGVLPDSLTIQTAVVSHWKTVTANRNVGVDTTVAVRMLYISASFRRLDIILGRKLSIA